MIYQILVIISLILVTNFPSPAAKVVIAVMLLTLSVKLFKVNYISLKKIGKANGLLIFYLLLLSIASFRNSDPKIELTSVAVINILFILFFIFFAGLAIYYLSRESGDSQKFIVNFIIIPFFVLALVNFILYFLNINPTVQVLAEDERGSAVMFSYLGFSVTRVIFPLASGLNEYTSYMGGIFCLTIWYFLTYKKDKFIVFMAGGAMLLSLLFVDSRAALLYPIFFSIIIFFLYRAKINFPFQVLAFLVILGPIIFVYILPLLANDSGLTSALSRHNNDIATGNTRFTIWRIAARQFASFEPIHLVGWGQTGHFASGSSQKWAYLFDGWKNANMKSPHSTVFSILFDEGYIGLVVYITLLYKSFKKAVTLRKYKPITAFACIIFLLYNILSGFSESLGGFYLINYVYLFTMVVIVINIEYEYLNKRQIVILTVTNEDE